MRKIIILIAAIAFLFLITTRMVRGYTEAITQKRVEREQIALQARVDAMTIEEAINYIAPQYGQDPALIYKITHCESRHVLEADHDGGHGKGVTGFHKRTFEDWKVKLGRPELRYESNFDQITLMSLAFSKGEDYRRAWTTYRAHKNGGTYSFYSNLLKGHYTVVCK
jgi:hypothetical protein